MLSTALDPADREGSRTPTNRDDVLIFVHIPKTGGMTLDHVIRRQFADQPVLWISYDRADLVAEFNALDAMQKAQLRCLAGHVPFGIDTDLPRNPVYITMLRDPVARFISEYEHAKRLPREGKWRPPADRMESLDNFLDYRIETNAIDAQTRFISGDIPPPGMPPPFDPLPADALERAKHNLRHNFAVVGLTERFDESLLLMRKRLGWGRHIFYARRNTAPPKASHRGIPPSTLARIRKHTELDDELVRFGAKLLEEAIREEGEQFQKELRRLRRVNDAIFRLTGAWKRSALHQFADAPGFRHVRLLAHYLMR